MVDYPPQLNAPAYLRTSSIADKEAAKRTFRLNYPRLAFCNVTFAKSIVPAGADTDIRKLFPEPNAIPDFNFEQEEGLVAQITKTRSALASRRQMIKEELEKKRAKEAQELQELDEKERQALEQSALLAEMKKAQEMLQISQPQFSISRQSPPPYEAKDLMRPKTPQPGPVSPAPSPPVARVDPAVPQVDKVKRFMTITGVDSFDKSSKLLVGYNYDLEKAVASYYDNGCDISTAIAQIKRPSLSDPLANNAFLRPSNQATLEIRLPNAPAVSTNFACDDTLWTVYQYVSVNCNKAFTLQKMMPNGTVQTFSEPDLNQTLVEAGLAPNGVIQVKLGDFR